MKQSACGIFTLHPWEIPLNVQAESNTFYQGAFKRRFLELILEQKISEFWIVLDQGLPCALSELILSLKPSFQLSLTCLIPFEEQHIDWSDTERERYFSILQHCDQEYLLSSRFSVDCYQQSVKKLMEHCGLLFVVWGGKPGDAGDAIQYAKRMEHRVISLTLDTLLRNEQGS